ncbi:hypothetical protein GPECTOR_3g352 [Gonium pectorale]|uniref:Right handed beta helix domain-containing protein n=1 Tax=Gonium pectorale TaxID=33097 RepID=A0A150GZC3_GONPE|nr:hypothetical protein GPECTOR_3g352 [Gonium pectorale]|eukprot:KXZ55209.1 hypothetical protein GPECTOR_3g352 [Gonium pectorale]
MIKTYIRASWAALVIVLALRSCLAAGSHAAKLEGKAEDGASGLARRSLAAPLAPQDDTLYDCQLLGVTGLLFNITVPTTGFSLRNVTFRNCAAGALALSAPDSSPASASLTSLTFLANSNNATTSYGGALTLSGPLSATLVDCTFAANSAAIGSAVYSTAGAATGEGGLTLQRCTFAGNRGQGAVAVLGGVLLAVRDSVFANNSGGSAVYLSRTRDQGAATVLYNVTFDGNVADGTGLSADPASQLGNSGGALYAVGALAALNVTSCSFTRNR